MADHDPKIVPARDVRQRVGLLAGKDETARFRTRKSPSLVGVDNLVPFPFCHESGGAKQALFGLDHVAGGEAIFSASVLAEFDQTGGAAHRTHDLVELLDSVAVPVRKLCHVAAREGRLLLSDRVQPRSGFVMIRAPLPRAISRAPPRSASFPSPR